MFLRWVSYFVSLVLTLRVLSLGGGNLRIKKISSILVISVGVSSSSSGQFLETVWNVSSPVIHGGRIASAYGTARFAGPAIAGNAFSIFKTANSPENIRSLMLAVGEVGVFGETLWSMAGGVPSGAASLFSVAACFMLERYMHRLVQSLQMPTGANTHFSSSRSSPRRQGRHMSSSPRRGMLEVSPLRQRSLEQASFFQTFLAPLLQDPSKFHTVLHLPDFFDLLFAVGAFSPKTQDDVDIAHVKVMISTPFLCMMMASDAFHQNRFFGSIEAVVGIHALNEHVFPLLPYQSKGDREFLLQREPIHFSMMLSAAIGMAAWKFMPSSFGRFSPPLTAYSLAGSLAMAHVMVSSQKVRLFSHIVTQFLMAKYFSFPAFRDKPLELHLLVELHALLGYLVTLGVDYYSSNGTCSSSNDDL